MSRDTQITQITVFIKQYRINEKENINRISQKEKKCPETSGQRFLLCDIHKSQKLEKCKGE